MRFLFLSLICFCSSLFAEGEPFILQTMQKSGTFYLKSILLHTVHKGIKFHSNTASDEHFGIIHTGAHANPNYKVVFLRRDLRDILCSYREFVTGQVQMYLRKNPNAKTTPWLHGYTTAFMEMTEEEQFLYLLDPKKPNELRLNMLSFKERYLEAVASPRYCVLSFEEITGSKGGGSTEAQHKAFEKLINFLHLSCTVKEMTAVANRVWGHDGTFRKGQIGSWKSQFSNRVKEAFKASDYGHYLILMGYERNMDW